VTKLGRLVKDGKIKSLEEIYLFSLPIKVIIILKTKILKCLVDCVHFLIKFFFREIRGKKLKFGEFDAFSILTTKMTY
jgi:small subunit ribosomal protein S2e